MRERTLCRQQMASDLMKAYRDVVSEELPQGITQTEVYDMVVVRQAPRFYIDPRRAHLRISRMMRGDYSELEELNPLKQMMYRDLFEVVMRLSHRKSYKSLYAVLKDAVLENAPRFYISGKRMGQIWRMKNEESRLARMKRYENKYKA